MFCVGTLAAVSSVISRYPFFGGQALRYTLAAIILFTIVRLKRLGPTRLTTTETLLVLALAATGLATFNLCVVQATKYTSPAVVGTIVGSVPLVLALVGPLLAKSRPAGRVVLASIVVVIGAGISTGFGGTGALGSLYAVGALACEACFSLLAVPLLPKLGPIRVSAYTTAAAVPMLLIAGIAIDGRRLLRVPTMAEVAGFGYLATVVTVGAFLLWYDALRRLGPDRAGLFAGMLPIGAIVTTMVLGRGLPMPAQFIGSLMVIVGLTLGMRPGRGRVSRSPVTSRNHDAMPPGER